MEFIDSFPEFASYAILIFGVIGFMQLIKQLAAEKTGGVWIISGVAVLGLIAGISGYGGLNWATGVLVGFAAAGLAAFMPKKPE